MYLGSSMVENSYERRKSQFHVGASLKISNLVGEEI